jgi:hypothetical protein
MSALPENVEDKAKRLWERYDELERYIAGLEDEGVMDFSNLDPQKMDRAQLLDALRSTVQKLSQVIGAQNEIFQRGQQLNELGQLSPQALAELRQSAEATMRMKEGLENLGR